MPDIRLQEYVAKVKELIRSVRLDEAIAHSQHILRHYPKYIEAYCLLGEACLEKEMYREAIEFFQRTLGADPENLISRVGLGVIYDEQGAFPEAIWQLERAFELVPGNAEVRRELLRLYGQYDAIDKTRLKLTRGALGRLYSRNGLYERAIGEFRAVLRQDPELPDIRVALVESLWREGRQVEAVEMCLELLDALPNCLKANLILGDIWLRGGNEESAGQRLSVARALDPENIVAQELMGSDSPLPPEQVLIPELDAMPDAFDFAPEGVLGAGAIVAEEAVETIADGAPYEEQEPWGSDEELPEWLRDVGVTAEAEPALDLAAEESVFEPPPDGSLPVEEMPEWLREVMGEEGLPPAGGPATVEGEPFEDEFAAEQEAAESLESLEAADAAAIATRAGLAGGAALAGGPVAAGMLDEADQEATGDEVTAEEMPEWLEELVGVAALPLGEEPVPEAEELAAPLVAGISEEEIAALPVVEVEEEAPAFEEEALPADEIPDWLRDLDKSEVEEIAAPPAVEVEDEAPALEEEAVPADEIPDWLRDLGAVEVEDVAEPLAAEADTEVIPVQPVAEIEEEAVPADEIPDWLRDLDKPEVEEIAAPPAVEVEEEAPALEEEAVPADEIPDWLRDLGAVEVGEVVETLAAEAETDGIEVPAGAEVEEAPVVTEEIPLIDEIPDWLRDLDAAVVEEVAAPPIAETGAEAVEEGAVPASLLALVAAGLLDEADLESAMAEMSDEELDSQRAEEVPGWLSELVEEEPIAAEPEPVPSAPFLQEISLPVTEMAADEEPPVEEAVLEAVEPEAEVFIEEAVPEAVEPEPEVLVEEAVLEAVEPEAEVFIEEAVLEVTEPEPEVLVEEAVPEVELEPEVLVEEAVLEVELEPEVLVEEAVLEVEPEPEVLVEEAVLEAVEAEPEMLVEEAVPEAVELEREVLVEEAVPEAVEAEPEVLVEEAVPEAVEAEPEVLVEEAALEVVEEIAAPARADELMAQLKTRPRDYSARLELARLHYGDQDWDAALANYEKLISARRFLPDVVDDLESLVDQGVEPVRVYHMLGDAYMQQDQLDEALEMYRLARQKLTKR